MKLILAFTLALVSASFVLAQNEQSPLVEKEFEYKDWVYKNVNTGSDMNLRKFTNGKKLVMVVYFAPWCPNWKHDAPFVQQMYDKYKSSGFDVIAVGEYDPVEAMKTHIEQYKLTFPVVWESDARTAKQATEHYRYRRLAGDTRNWGSPWYVFLEVDKLTPGGLVMAKRVPVVNGELIQADVEKFIKESVAAPSKKTKGAVAAKTQVEVCEAYQATSLKVPFLP